MLYIVKVVWLKNSFYDLERSNDLKTNAQMKALGRTSFNNKTYELCKLAVQNDGEALEYIDDQTEELCLIAINEYEPSIKYVKNKSFLK